MVDSVGQVLFRYLTSGEFTFHSLTSVSMNKQPYLEFRVHSQSLKKVIQYESIRNFLNACSAMGHTVNLVKVLYVSL